ncbi:MAG TPA: TIGR01458 family HAD-type hydrolase [Candidatus Krumholzibacteria bacterium]|nr:TIGR01458 family HAD-type hydrolase [Candidatus Krumholzibacteria bacterium]
MQMHEFGDIKGLLTDMDGVWFVGDRALPGAIEALARIRARAIPIRFVTNTTTTTRAEMARRMLGMGFDVDPSEFVTTPTAAASLMRQAGIQRVKLVISPSIRNEFPGLSTAPPHQAVVIGDIGRAWNYDLMSDLFKLIMDGAEIVALHKGRYWQVPEGLALDIGAFVAGLEYATGKTAAVVGKPSPAMFYAALTELEMEGSDVVMIGDDIYNDIAGAQSASIRAVLVKSGKYRESAVARSGVTPDLVIDSIAELVRF